jgi:hypothetical protein
MLDYEKMAKREHKRTDEIGNMVTFLSGLGCAKKLHLSPKIPEVSCVRLLNARKYFLLLASFGVVIPNCKRKVPLSFFYCNVHKLQLP